MNLAIFLAFGSSLEDLKRHGQDRRFVDYYLKKYLKHFEKIYIFSYADESYSLPEGAVLVPNRAGLPRFFYVFLLPFIHRRLLKNCSVGRVMQANGALPAVVAQKLYGLPPLITYGYDYAKFAEIEKHFWRARLFKIYEKLILSLSAAFVAPSKESEKHLAGLGVKTDRIYYVPNGVDTEIFSPTAKNFNRAEIKILFVGRLEAQKNLEILLETASLSRHKENIRLTFIGRGNEKEKLLKAAESKGLKLKIIDGAPHEELPAHYRSADIFAMLSRAEGHPKTLLEAASCGLPCLVSKEILSGDFRDSENVAGAGASDEESAARLDELIENEFLRRRLSENARRLIVENFNLNQLLEKEIKILKNLSDYKKQ